MLTMPLPPPRCHGRVHPRGNPRWCCRHNPTHPPPPPTPYIFPSQMLWRVMSHMSPILRNTLDVPYFIPTQMMSYCLPESDLVRNSIASADLHNPININAQLEIGCTVSISWRSTTPRMSSFCNNHGELKLMRNVALFNVLHGIWIITTSYIWWIYPTSTQMLCEIFRFIPNSMPVILCCTSCEIECLQLINISQTKFASPSTSANPDSASHPQLAVEDQYYLILWMLLNYQFHGLP